MKDNVMSMASSLFIHIRTLDRKMKRKRKNTSHTQWSVEKTKAKAGQKTCERVGSHLDFVQMKCWVGVRKKCSWHALELSQDRENEKNTHLHYINMSITWNILMQINILFYSMCSNIIVWPNATLCAIY